LKKEPQTEVAAPPADCAEAGDCPLTSVAAGTVVCIKQLVAQPDVVDRLRELGLGEQQRVRLVSRHPSLICQVCNARVALSEQLAHTILVKPLTPGS
jgi:Fe2+ transport system protein FeoA